MKYVKQPKRHIELDDFEWRALVKGINEYRKQVIDEDEAFFYGFQLGVRLMIEAGVPLAKWTT